MRRYLSYSEDNFEAFRLAGVTRCTDVGAMRRYLSYSDDKFEAFRFAGVTRCTDVRAIWHVGSSVPNCTPIGATIRV